MASNTLATAIQIGDPVSIKRAVRVLKAFDGVVEDASEEELADAAAAADREGAFACPQTGVALAALIKLARAGTIGKGATVAVISTAHGLKFSDFKQGYHAGKGALANPPVEVSASVDAVRRELEKRLPVV